MHFRSLVKQKAQKMNTKALSFFEGSHSRLPFTHTDFLVEIAGTASHSQMTDIFCILYQKISPSLSCKRKDILSKDTYIYQI